MAIQTYTVITPLTLNGLQYAQGSTLQMDDTNATTIQLLGLRNPPVALTSDPGTAAKLAAAQAITLYESQYNVPPSQHYAAEGVRNEDLPTTTGGNPSLPTHPLEGVDGDDALRYQ